MMVIGFYLTCRYVGKNFDAEYHCDCILSPEKGNIIMLVKYTNGV
jgi:hypothetical protein